MLGTVTKLSNVISCSCCANNFLFYVCRKTKFLLGVCRATNFLLNPKQQKHFLSNQLLGRTSLIPNLLTLTLYYSTGVVSVVGTYKFDSK